jgi:hypothetical protein
LEFKLSIGFVHPGPKPNSTENSAEPNPGRLFLGANRVVLPEPTDAANRCNLRHVAPKTLHKALYVGFSQIGRPLQVVCLGWSQFPVPEARLAG